LFFSVAIAEKRLFFLLCTIYCYEKQERSRYTLMTKAKRQENVEMTSGLAASERGNLKQFFCSVNANY
jgi:hypothetical protein